MNNYNHVNDLYYYIKQNYYIDNENLFRHFDKIKEIIGKNNDNKSLFKLYIYCNKFDKVREMIDKISDVNCIKFSDKTETNFYDNIDDETYLLLITKGFTINLHYLHKINQLPKTKSLLSNIKFNFDEMKMLLSCIIGRHDSHKKIVHKNELIFIFSPPKSFYNHKYNLGDFVKMCEFDQDSQEYLFNLVLHYHDEINFNSIEKSFNFKQININIEGDADINVKIENYLINNKIKCNIQLTLPSIHHMSLKFLKYVLKNDYGQLDLNLNDDSYCYYRIEINVNKFIALTQYKNPKELIVICFNNIDCMKYYYEVLNLTIDKDEFTDFVINNKNIFYECQSLYYDKKWMTFNNICKLCDNISCTDRKGYENIDATHLFLSLYGNNYLNNFNDLEINTLLQYIAKFSLKSFSFFVDGICDGEHYTDNMTSSKWKFNDTHVINLVFNDAIKTSLNKTIMDTIKKMDNFFSYTELLVASIQVCNYSLTKIIKTNYEDKKNVSLIKDYLDGKKKITLWMDPNNVGMTIEDNNVNDKKKKDKKDLVKIKALF